MSEVPLYPGLVNVGWLVAGLLEFRYLIIQAMLALIHQPLPPWDASNGSNANDSTHTFLRIAVAQEYLAHKKHPPP